MNHRYRIKHDGMRVSPAEVERMFREGENPIFFASTWAEEHETYSSIPGLDARTVRGGVRMHPLREVAGRHISTKMARVERKITQFRSGIQWIIQQLARTNGYKKSVQGYLVEISRAKHDNRAGY